MNLHKSPSVVVFALALVASCQDDENKVEITSELAQQVHEDIEKIAIKVFGLQAGLTDYDSALDGGARVHYLDYVMAEDKRYTQTFDDRLQPAFVDLGYTTFAYGVAGGVTFLQGTSEALGENVTVTFEVTFGADEFSVRVFEDL